jgi:hypothetical protein
MEEQGEIRDRRRWEFLSKTKMAKSWQVLARLSVKQPTMWQNIPQ